MSSFSADDTNIVHARDTLSFQVDGLGFLATSSVNEPIQETEESITQLRIASQEADTLDYLRCVFRIESDSSQVIDFMP
jgi:hypothetical protein